MKRIILWIAAILLTLSAAFYQRMTGPTYPLKFDIELNEFSYTISMPRSYGGEKFDDCEIKLEIPDHSVSGKIFYRRYPTNEKWDSANFFREKREISSFISRRIFSKHDEDVLVVELPNQPPAGKLEYYLELTDKKGTNFVAQTAPIVIRFKGAVPLYFLVPHIILMFLAMCASNLAGFFAIWKIKQYKLYTLITLCCLFVGGLVFGSIVQKFAFDEFWAGVPFGWDLTDNKILIGFGVWLAAVIGNWRKDRPYLTIVAAVVLLAIYSIPHSLYGSELDYSTGKVIQGLIFVAFVSISRKKS